MIIPFNGYDDGIKRSMSRSPMDKIWGGGVYENVWIAVNHWLLYNSQIHEMYTTSTHCNDVLDRRVTTHSRKLIILYYERVFSKRVYVVKGRV